MLVTNVESCGKGTSFLSSLSYIIWTGKPSLLLFTVKFGTVIQTMFDSILSLILKKKKV